MEHFQRLWVEALLPSPEETEQREAVKGAVQASDAQAF